MQPKLRAVQSDDTHKPDMAGDIYAADKARIAATDWAKVHVTGDRSAPVDFPDRPRLRSKWR